MPGGILPATAAPPCFARRMSSRNGGAKFPYEEPARGPPCRRRRFPRLFSNHHIRRLNHGGDAVADLKRKLIDRLVRDRRRNREPRGQFDLDVSGGRSLRHRHDLAWKNIARTELHLFGPCFSVAAAAVIINYVNI